MHKLACLTALRRPSIFALASVLWLTALPAQAAEWSFAIHPVLPRERTVEVYQPLLDYLKQATGHSFRLETSGNFLSYWHLMKRGNFDLVLDGPHFTDYRAQKMGYMVLAKLPDVVSYTLVANENLMALEPTDLIGKTIATTPSPALGALRLAELYPNPLRQPTIVETDDSVDAAEKVVAGKVAGAMIPAPLVGRFPSLTTVATTGQVPSPAISASTKVPTDVQQAIKKALLEAPNHPAGKKALEAMNTPTLEDSNNHAYAGMARLLEGVWGY